METLHFKSHDKVKNLPLFIRMNVDVKVAMAVVALENYIVI